MLAGPGEQRFDVGAVGDIGLQRDRPFGSDLGGQFVGTLAAAPVVEDDGGSFVGERLRDGVAEAATGAGDEDDLVLQ